ncbi:Ger(x)C family spore germination protein [uncultured Paenibacillus sp.]|uniref:Ger(x)C family spore germination protein n=1 Tax=uncultured Paenibacillus sp. TaxID=227322 RepID=UPI0015AFF236|nr:Ger(x)C family spore germination protein [uncultured Paenibacillus sp.]
MRGGRRFFRTAAAFRLQLIPAVLLPSLVLTGCWDRIEVNDVAFVLATSTDMEQGQVRSTAQIALPSSMGGAGSQGGGGGTSGSKTYLMVSQTAPTPYQASKSIQSNLSRILNFSHRRVTIIGGAFAKSGIGGAIDVLARFPQNRLTTYVVLSRGPGYKLLDVEAPIEQSPSEMIRELAKSAMKEPISIQSMANTLLTEGSDLAVPVMTTTQSVPQKVGNGQSLVKLDGLGVFRDDKLSGYLTAEQTPIALIAMGQALNPKLTVPGGQGPQESATIVFNEIRRKLRPHLEKAGISFDLEVKANGLILENVTRQDFQHTMMMTLEKHTNEYLAKEMQSVINETLHKHRSDIFGLSAALNNKYPATWKKIQHRWHDMLPDIKVRIRTNVHLENSGELINSLGIREELLNHE